MLHEEVLCNEVHVLVRARSREWQIPVLLPFSFLFFAPLEQVCIGRAITRRVDLLGRSLSRSGYDLVGFSLMGIGGKWRIFTETCKGRTAAEGTSHCFLKSPRTNRLGQRCNDLEMPKLAWRKETSAGYHSSLSGLERQPGLDLSPLPGRTRSSASSSGYSGKA